MIYLIAGAPRVGKSILAQRIARERRISFISTDDLDERVRAGMTEEEAVRAFPLFGFSGTASENVLRPEERVELQYVCARSLEPEIEWLIEEAIMKNTMLIMEGVHLLPDFVKKMMNQFGVQNFRAIFIGFSEIEHILDGMKKNSNPHDWLRDADEVVRCQVAEFVSAFSRSIKYLAEKEQLNYLERTIDFETDVDKVRAFLES